jgi:hypothetical protein
MSVTREKLYEEIWAEPITKVSRRYGVSDSFLVRVLQRMNVPRPPMGYWAKLAVGKTVPRLPLPEAEPGNELEWLRNGEPKKRHTPPRAPDTSRPTRMRKRAERPSQHHLVSGAKIHFENVRETEAGYLKPTKKLLPDLLVSKNTLDRALDIANELFLMLEDRGYSVTLMASPRRSRFDGFHSWGGLVQETPKVVEEHAAYRAIREKLRQHKVNEPHLVCIGSDVSPVLSSVPLGWGIRLEQALSAAVQKSSELSGVLVVNIEQTAPAFGGVTRTARCTAYPIPNCRYPLTEDEWAFIRNLDLNRWKYTNSLPIKEVPPAHRVRHVSGPIQQSTSPGGQVKLTIPTNVLVDVLAGRTQLLSQCGGEEDNFGKSVAQCLQEGWSIIGCSFQDGDLQQGISASVEIELAPPYASVFWPPK